MDSKRPPREANGGYAPQGNVPRPGSAPPAKPADAPAAQPPAAHPKS